MKADEMVVVVPTRGRPHAVGELVQAWRDTEAAARLVFVVDNDDPTEVAYAQQYGRHVTGRGHQDPVSMWFGPRLRLAGSLNHAGMVLAGHHAAVGFMGDDHRPRTPGWDQRFAECLSGGTGIVYGNDLLVGEKFPTAVMMTSDIPLALGHLCPPGFVHLNLDVVWGEWGQAIGRLTYLPDVIIEHLHPAAGKAEMDPGYTEVNSDDQKALDGKAHQAYHEDGRFDADVAKLAALL